MLERLRRRIVVKTGKTDIRRWTNLRSHEPAWGIRSAFAAAACHESRYVCDLGCGMQLLRSLLPPHITYLPADLHNWTPDTAICDLNAKILPVAYLERADTVTMLGVLEYIYDPIWLLANLASFIDMLVVSYNPKDFTHVDRPSNGWVNAYSLVELVRVFHSNGFILKRIERISEHEVLVVSVKNSVSKKA